MRSQIFGAALAALFAAPAANAAIYAFDFVSQDSKQVGGFGLPWVDGQEGPIRARLYLDLPNLVNQTRSTAWSRDGGPSTWLLGGTVDGSDIMFAQLGGRLAFTTRGDGTLQELTFSLMNDYPDFSFDLGTAAWGDSSELYYIADGNWAISGITPEPSPVPLPAAGLLLAAALSGLGIVNRKRKS